MAYRIFILDDAQREFQEIVNYLLNVMKSPQATEGFIGEFEHQASLIEEDPHIFVISKMPELAAKGYRVAFINRYIMLYTTRDDDVFIAHFFHQRQDYARLV